eukprot:Seg6109.1 transcript_id=Seg6109.1/GoldUCD/mRNA.D3Y31 product="hypothetical protein" protein_id=Seg6109.1/GoldUCD/D3Y31
MRILLRQMIAENYLEQVFLESSPDGRRRVMTRFLAIAPKGREFKVEVESKPKEILFPRVEPKDSLLSKPKPKCTGKSTSKNVQVLPRLKRMLEDSNRWIKIEKKEQYMFLGFEHDTSQLLYAEDSREAPGRPIARNQDHFLWTDINLSKGQSHPLVKAKVTISEKETEVVVKKSPCNGVKVCGEKGCQFAVAKKYHANKCIQHEDAVLVDTGKCPGTLVYVYPSNDEDYRRWLGFFSRDETAVHNHHCPSQNKAGSKLEEMIKECMERDPTKTAADIHKGYGLQCMPAAVSLVGASKTSIKNMRKKFLLDHKEISAKKYVQKFDSLVRRPLDEKDESELDGDVKDRIEKLVLPYQRNMHCDNDIDNALFMSPQMSSVLANSDFICADVTFPDVAFYKYLLNVAAFNLILMEWQVVARVLMTRMSSKAYTNAFDLIFTACTSDSPAFENGQGIVGIVVDFSDAQAKGVENVMGCKKAAEVLRGCRVHWMRQAERQAERIGENEIERRVFVKVCKAIPDETQDSKINTMFDVLSGKTKVSVLTTILELDAEERSIDNARWSKAKHWTSWWRKPKHAKMFIKGAKEMSNASWALCPETTNAVESMNRISVPNGSLTVKGFLEHLYRIDKNAAYQTVARQEGINVCSTQLARKKKASSQRKWRSSKSYKVDDQQDSEVDITLEMGKGDELIGKDLLVETTGKRGKNYGFCKATIVSKENGAYRCKYHQWEDSFVLIPEEDLHNKSDIVLIP